MKVHVAVEVSGSGRRYARFSLHGGDYALFRRILTAYGTTVRGMRTRSGALWRQNYLVPMSAALLASAALQKRNVQLYAPKEIQAELRHAAWKCRVPDLYPHQRSGAEFLRSRKRALLADEMGIGKTACALAALDAKKGALIIVPPVVLGNWHEEARRWRPDLAVTLWKRPYPLFPEPGEIRIATYSGLPWESVEKRTRCPYCNHLSVIQLDAVPRAREKAVLITENNPLKSEIEELDEAAFDALASASVPKVSAHSMSTDMSISSSVSVSVSASVSAWKHHCDSARGGCGKKFNQRDDVWEEHVWVGEKVREGAAVQLVVDEAHYCKNRDSKRGITVRGVASQCSSTWLLTGTPLLNNPTELWTLCQLFPGRGHDGGAGDVFGSWWSFVELFGGEKKHFGGYDWNGKVSGEARERLGTVMLRRTRAEVLPDLPVKTRRVVEVDIDHSELSKLVTITSNNLMRFEEWTDADVLRECEPGGALSQIRKELAGLKYKPLISLIEDCEDALEPVVVFSYHREPILRLGERAGWACITGSTSERERTMLVQAFQAGTLKGLAGTIGAMGVGVTLTRSAFMFFLDRDYVPANNLQAEDRQVRIGQTRGVLITILNTDHPVDQRVAQILERKERLLEQMHLGEARAVTKKTEKTV